jgi:hypothetical protein
MKEHTDKQQEDSLEKVYGRKHSKAVREQMRKEAIRMKKWGMRRNEIAGILGVSPGSQKGPGTGFES